MTDPQGHAAATSLVTAGTVLLGGLLLAAGCARGPALATTYLAIAQPANRELDHEFDGLGDHVQDGELAAAQADLRAVAATERSFDRQLTSRRPIPADRGRPAVN